MSRQRGYWASTASWRCRALCVHDYGGLLVFRQPPETVEIRAGCSGRNANFAGAQGTWRQNGRCVVVAVVPLSCGQVCKRLIHIFLAFAVNGRRATRDWGPRPAAHRTASPPLPPSASTATIRCVHLLEADAGRSAEAPQRDEVLPVHQRPDMHMPTSQLASHPCSTGRALPERAAATGSMGHRQQ